MFGLKYPVSIFLRITFGAAGLLFLLISLAFGLFYAYGESSPSDGVLPIVPVIMLAALAVGSLFLYTALKGRPPEWLER